MKRFLPQSILLFLLLSGFCSMAQDTLNRVGAGLSDTLQNSKVSGYVIDEKNNPLSGVDVMVSGMDISTKSDSTGRYSIELPNLQFTLVFSLPGYLTFTYPINGRTLVMAKLKEDKKYARSNPPAIPSDPADSSTVSISQADNHLPAGNSSKMKPFYTWNMGGVTGIFQQPAAIFDPHLRFDMILFGLDITAGNSLYGLKRGAIFGGDFDEDKQPLTKIDNHRALVNIDLHLLNFAFAISKKSALAFHTRIRTMLNVDGVDRNMLHIIDNDGDYAPFYGKNYTLNDLGFRANAWADIGITYAREIIDLNEHYLKGGVTIKLLQPFTSGYLYIDHADYTITQSTGGDDVDFRAQGEMAMPTGIVDFEDFIDIDNIFDDFNFGKNMGVGFDLGVVYEYRPEGRKYKNPDGSNQYLFRVGISLLDIGSMKYNSDYSQKFAMTSDDVIDIDNIDNIDDLRNAFGLVPESTTYKMALPTALSIQTDWRIYEWLHLGVNPYLAMHQKRGNNIGTHYISSINVTPRIGIAQLGLAMPMTYDQFRAFNVGLGIRLGPIWIGSNNIFNVLMSNKLREVNLCFGLKISVFRNS